MENAENLEIKAHKNLDIAVNEKLIFKDSKIKVEQELKSVKAREVQFKRNLYPKKSMSKNDKPDLIYTIVGNLQYFPFPGSLD